MKRTVIVGLTAGALLFSSAMTAQAAPQRGNSQRDERRYDARNDERRYEARRDSRYDDRYENDAWRRNSQFTYVNRIPNLTRAQARRIDQIMRQDARATDRLYDRMSRLQWERRNARSRQELQRLDHQIFVTGQQIDRLDYQTHRRIRNVLDPRQLAYLDGWRGDGRRDRDDRWNRRY